MKYQTASYIRSLIDALMIENGEGSLQCACVDTHDDDLEWRVCLFSRNDDKVEMMRAYTFAFSLKAISPTLCCYLGSYNCATVGIDIRDAVVII